MTNNSSCLLFYGGVELERNRLRDLERKFESRFNSYVGVDLKRSCNHQFGIILLKFFIDRSPFVKRIFCIHFIYSFILSY